MNDSATSVLRSPSKRFDHHSLERLLAVLEEGEREYHSLMG
jgi:hypothetical protein